MLSRNIDNKLPTSAGEHHVRAKTSDTLRWKSEVLHVIDLIMYMKSMLSIMMIVPIHFLCHHLFFPCLHMQLKALGYVKEAIIEVGKTRCKWEDVHILHLLFRRLCFGDK
jgi:hypothetical protein